MTSDGERYKSHVRVYYRVWLLIVARAVQWLNVRYTIWFNNQHHRGGRLLHGRFKAVLVEPERWAIRLSRYMHLNPARLQSKGRGGRRLQPSGPPPAGVVQAELKTLR